MDTGDAPFRAWAAGAAPPRRPHCGPVRPRALTRGRPTHARPLLRRGWPGRSAGVHGPSSGRSPPSHPPRGGRKCRKRKRRPLPGPWVPEEGSLAWGSPALGLCPHRWQCWPRSRTQRGTPWCSPRTACAACGPAGKAPARPEGQGCCQLPGFEAMRFLIYLEDSYREGRGLLVCQFTDDCSGQGCATWKPGASSRRPPGCPRGCNSLLQAPEGAPVGAGTSSRPPRVSLWVQRPAPGP